MYLAYVETLCMDFQKVFPWHFHNRYANESDIISWQYTIKFGEHIYFSSKTIYIQLPHAKTVNMTSESLTVRDHR